MRKSTPILLSVTVLLIVSLASGLPSPLPSVAGPTLDSNTLGTAIMQTMVVALTQTSGAGTPVAPVDLAPTFTPTPTLSPTATASSTPFVIFTSTSAVPLVSVSVNTNCRVGPGQIYNRVGALVVGQVAEVLGRNSAGNYWYIKNPAQTTQYCWLWGEYATVTGNVGALPVFTPPPPPTFTPTPTPSPSFIASYVELERCSGNWWANIELENTGSITFRSMVLTLRDTTDDKDTSLHTDSFTVHDDCGDSDTANRLRPDDTLTVSTATFNYNPRGHKLRAFITLCSGEDQNGTCITETIRFTP